MTIKIVVPPLGESVSEATVAKWHKKPGEAVKTDQLLLELETDKVTLEVNSPSDGVLAEITVPEGGVVGVGALLGAIDPTAKGAAAPSAVPTQQVSAAPEKKMETGPITSPSAGKIASEKGIDLSSVSGTGKDGRITKEDVMGGVPVATRKEVREERVKMSRLRKTIAQRLKDSQNTAAILTTFNEIDMSKVFEIRKKHQDRFVEKHGVKLGFMSFFTKAVVAALKEIPSVNAQIDGDYIVYKNYYDVGIAVGTDQGLVVPIVRDADQKSFADIEKELVALSKKAREGKLSMEEMTGGTFSITNGGTYGSLLSTPIINPPQSGILGMHNIIERPMAVNGQVEIKPMMYVAFSYDHRIIDGKEAVTFLVMVKKAVENPECLLLDL